MRQAEPFQEVFVEEVAERTMADVVQEGSQSQKRFHVAAARYAGADIGQAAIQGGDGAAGQVHRSQNVLETRVLGGGKDPERGLQLMNLPQPLHPGMIDQVALRHLTRHVAPAGEGNVPVDRIVAQRFELIVAHAEIMPVGRGSTKGCASVAGQGMTDGHPTAIITPFTICRFDTRTA